MLNERIPLLSYRHSFHAGNFADVIKHIVLVDILSYLTKKESPFEYIDTHSGVGLYNLQSEEAQKLQEFSNGIGKINRQKFPELSEYFEVVDSFNHSNNLEFYPGSPSFAQYFLRKQDRAWLYELHPNDVELLQNNMVKSRKIRVQHQDGFKGLKAVIPPMSKRALVLVDPSYEIKSDYQLVATSIIKAYKKFRQGVYAIWYPVVQRETIDSMEQTLIDSGIRNIQRFELGLSPDTKERGMTSSGMIVINPPWTLFNRMSELLPKLAKELGETNELIYKCDVLVEE